MWNGFSWNKITHVLLDLDGTLLDRDFDDVFWERTVPGEYALQHGISFEDAHKKFMTAYQNQEGTQNWFDIDYWSREFGLDIFALQVREEEKICPLPGTIEFLEFIHNMGKSVHIITDAHPQTVSIKMGRVPLDRYFDTLLSAFEVKCIKKEPCFWTAAQEIIGFSTESTLFIDDRPAILESAQQFGISYVFHKAGASSSRPHEFHGSFFPIIDFKEIIYT